MSSPIAGSPKPNSYDEVLYPGHAMAQTHPNRLATIATLFGLDPPELARCRVLELGCGDGTNLISFALELPGAQFLGIDLAAAGLVNGRALAAEVGASNVALEQRDLMDIGPDFGEFDYIIAHGVYSWVPPAVRDKLLAVCKQNLAPHGVAYVSYNAQPGGHFREMIREMMQFHIAEMRGVREITGQARALLSFIVESEKEPDLYRGIIKAELERITEYNDNFLYHDDLAEFNQPEYFYKFAAAAQHHGLQYLGEAHFMEMNPGKYRGDVIDTIHRMADNLVAAEQYLDFVKCRRFRQTLLCHAGQPVNRQPSSEVMRKFAVASPVEVESGQFRPGTPEAVKFRGPLNSGITTNQPLMQAALIRLGKAWPQAVRFDDLLAGACQDCGREASREDLGVVAGLVLQFYGAGGVEVHLHPPDFVGKPSERPVASPLARAQSRRGGTVTNLRHYQIPLQDPVSPALLQLLDGTRDRARLREDLIERIQAERIEVARSDGSVIPPGEVGAAVEDGLERHLELLAEHALLVR